MPPRFYCCPMPDPPEGLADARSDAGRCVLGPDESRHACKVLRLAVGDAVELFDGSGRIARARILDADAAAVICQIEQLRHARILGPSLTVASAVPKGPRAVEMVNQLAQLGVDAWVPLACERSVVDPRRWGLRGGQRYERGALAAAKQSGRPTLLRIEPAHTLAEALARPAARRLLLHVAEPDKTPGVQPALADSPGIYPNHDSSPWPSVWPEARQHGGEDEGEGGVWLLVGPEGGWSESEVAAAVAAEARLWRIAPHVLRIETAAIAAAAIAGYLATTAPPTPADRRD